MRAANISVINRKVRKDCLGFYHLVTQCRLGMSAAKSLSTCRPRHQLLCAYLFDLLREIGLGQDKSSSDSGQ